MFTAVTTSQILFSTNTKKEKKKSLLPNNVLDQALRMGSACTTAQRMHQAPGYF